MAKHSIAHITTQTRGGKTFRSTLQQSSHFQRANIMAFEVASERAEKLEENDSENERVNGGRKKNISMFRKGNK